MVVANMDPKETQVTLLVIDDDPAIVQWVKSALADQAIAVVGCTSPDEAVTVVRAQHPHIVITDLSMPEMSGMDVLRKILEIDPRTEVILLTGDYSTESAVKAIQQGASDYWTKPLELTTLRGRMEELANDVRRRRGIAAI